MNTPPEGQVVPSATFSPSSEDPKLSLAVGPVSDQVSALARHLARGTNHFQDFRQEGLLAACLAVQSFDEAAGASFSTYALRCARNRMLDGLRRERRIFNKTVSADAVMDAETGDSFIDLVPFRPSFIEVPENRYLVTQLHSAMDRLPERERAILQLSFFDELTHDEISLRLGLTRARVGQLVKQAIARLRKTLVQ